MELVQHGSYLIPRDRSLQSSAHPFWEWMLGPGRVWVENADKGLHRAALPLTITAKNANCVHNGIIMFLFDEHSLSKLWYQITSETCSYLKVNLFGLITAQYTPYDIAFRCALIHSFADELNGRIPVKSMEYLSSDFVDVSVDPPSPILDITKLVPPSAISPDHVTVYGAYINGVHYRSDANTRSGSYPFPDQMVLPSYSLAKSMFAGLAGMYMEQKYPGTMQSDLGVILNSNKWSGITVNDALDMTTGLYKYTGYLRDENLPETALNFFLARTHSQKLNHAVNSLPKRTLPRTEFAYHTSDTYVAIFALNQILKQQTKDDGADIYEYIYRDVYSKIGGSQIMKETIRTYDAERQPLGGYGLYFNTDDVVKTARFMNSGDGHHGMIDGEPVLSRGELFSALQQTNDIGIRVSAISDAPFYNYIYQNGFWSVNLEYYNGCNMNVPFWSGFGGIKVVLFPNGNIYYYFTDDGTTLIVDAATEMLKVCW